MIEQIKKETEDIKQDLQNNFNIEIDDLPGLRILIDKAYKLGLQRAIELAPEKRTARFGNPTNEELERGLGFNEGTDTYLELLRKEIE